MRSNALLALENFLLSDALKQFHNLSDIKTKISWYFFLERYLIFRKIGQKPAIKIIEENNLAFAYFFQAIDLLNTSKYAVQFFHDIQF